MAMISSSNKCDKNILNNDVLAVNVKQEIDELFYANNEVLQGMVEITINDIHNSQHGNIKIEMVPINISENKLSNLENKDDQLTIVKKKVKENINVRKRKEARHMQKKIVKCNICDARCINSNLKKHIIQHKPPYTCKICKKTFKSNHFFVHKHKPKYIIRKAFKCNRSGKHTLKSHVLSDQDLKKPLYKCYQCDKGFTKKCHLVDHFRIHTGHKPFKCLICNKGFTFKNCLTKHLNLHKAGLHNCNVCNRNFNKQEAFDKHMRTHSDDRKHRCNECGQKFVKSSHLKEHLRKHTGEQPYKCNMCGRAFSHNNSLTKHIRIHSDKKPYNCLLCRHGFAQLGNFKLHMTKHHPETKVDDNAK